MATIETVPKKESSLSIFEQYLVIWIPLCMLAGILLAENFPWISETIDNIQVWNISIPIGICLFFMMYPAVLNLKGSELKKLGKNPKPIILTLISNWFIAPIVGLVLANYFLAGNDDLIVAIILLSASPCTAMVLVWGMMAEGNQEQNVVNTSLNTITIMIFYAPLVAILTGLQNIPIDRWSLALSVILFIGLPIILGIISRNYLIARKGEVWFNETYRPTIGKVAIIALLSTLIILFALNGKTLIENPELLVQVSVPLILGFIIVVGYNVIITKIFGLHYQEAIITVIIGSSSHFEIAIATAIAVFGLGSVAALGTTMGLFWEIPIMLSIVYLGKYLGKRSFWNTEAKN